MSNVIIDREKIDILANAISAKSGETLPLTLTEMVEAVDGIEAGSAEPNLQAKTYTVDSAGTATVTADSGYDGLSEVDVSVPYADFVPFASGQYSTISGERKWVLDCGGYAENAGWVDDGAYATKHNYSCVPRNTTVTPTESAQTVGGDNYMMEGAVTVNAIPSNYVGSGITQRSSSDLTASGATVTVPAGYYSSSASKSIDDGVISASKAVSRSYQYNNTQLATSITPEQFTPGYFSSAPIFSAYQTVENKTVTPSESQQVVEPTVTNGAIGARYLKSVTVNAIPSNYVGSGITSRSSSDLTASGATVTVPSGYYSAQASKAVASGTAGTPTATKGTVSNHSVSVTPSVTNTTGYITGSTKTGTAVTVSASELVSGSDTVTTNDTYDVTNLAEIVVNVSGGGGVTVTDEANATGITCVITSGGSPTPSGIPLNTELIDFTKLTEDYAINSSGEAVATQWYCASDYTAVDPSMTFSYTGCTWYYIGVYNSSKEVVRTIYMYSDGTPDPDNNNLSSGTLSGSELTGASYVRITGVAVQSQYRLSLIRTA